MPDEAEKPKEKDLRQIAAYVLMVLYVIMTPIGLALAVGPGVGLVCFGLAAGSLGYLLGVE